MLTELLEVITATVEGHCKLDTGITLEELPAEGGIYAELGDGFEESTSYNKQEVKVIPVLFLCRHPDQKHCLEQLCEISGYLQGLKQYPQGKTFAWLNTEIAKEPITDKSKFVINPAYDTVLEVQKLYKEDTLTEFEKIDQALKMLVRNKWNLRLLNPEEKQKLLSVITKRYVEVEKRPQIKKSPFPVLDFEKDGDYIYASFMQAYKIDLIEEQGRLPWKKFLYLFNGLPADTKIKQIMRIRQMPVPEYNGKNSKEIQEINEMKSYYALPVEGGGGQSGLDLLFHTLEGMAKR